MICINFAWAFHAMVQEVCQILRRLFIELGSIIGRSGLQCRAAVAPTSILLSLVGKLMRFQGARSIFSNLMQWSSCSALSSVGVVLRCGCGLDWLVCLVTSRFDSNSTRRTATRSGVGSLKLVVLVDLAAWLTLSEAVRTWRSYRENITSDFALVASDAGSGFCWLLEDG